MDTGDAVHCGLVARNRNEADFLAVQALLAFAAEAPVGIQWFNVPRQPSNSVECGLHVAINLTLAVNKFLKAHTNKPNQRVIEYERALGPTITKWLANNIPLDVTWNEKDVLMVRFRRGKTARRGQYSIATTHPIPQITKYIQKMKDEGGLWLFPGLTKPNVSKLVKDHLRLHVAIHKIECRSLRRGRL